MNSIHTPQAIPDVSNPELVRRIAARIQERIPPRIPFAEYMDWVLYEPDLGYYTALRPKIGAAGDFATSPHLGADFGELLAGQFHQMWQHLGSPPSFTLVEMGAGQGLMALDVLRYLFRQAQATVEDYADFWAALDYVIFEKARVHVREQQFQLQRFPPVLSKIRWTTWDEVPPQSITGCFFSNEWVDALPVHIIERQGARLQEVYVTVGNEGCDRPFTEVLADLSTPRITSYLADLGVDLTAPVYAEGYRTEVNLGALDWLQAISDRLYRGYILTVDYGYITRQYYSPNRSQGTLQCYRRHASHTDPYWSIGHQDITAHVNFSALEHYGQAYGLTSLGFTQQGLFLMALGLGDRLVANNNPTDEPTATNLNDILRRREALHALINPLGLGGFGVLIQAKGLSTAEQTRTLTCQDHDDRVSRS
ncbi:class I SAM-dependent methyltransferase [Synechococcales cyanobacterium C]|uniref:Class I SAM-dependent methyltransferase n=1 Tax=Petrachloros mirabilis ULC683 TaxID=2781853 RepID=A0A8K1ZXA6_9CYAN|nr:SAM-dependent methyltransferase [Petrachloros mirabilis]NCJ05582.1 class I SAM-dependent methyltransferase [Petrachloros mirabilis ULC683]